MKTSIRFTALAIALVAGSAFADLVIVQKVQQSSPVPLDSEMTMSVKGDKVRVDIGDQVSTIVDSSNEDAGIVSLMHQQKMAMTVPKATVDAMRERAKAQLEGEDAGPDIKPTGNKETISGFECEEFKGTFQGMNVSYWITKDLPNEEQILEQLSKLSGDVDPFRGAFKDGEIPGFPIRTVIESDQSGASTMTVVSVEEKNVDESLFAIPDGYKSMEMPQTPGQ